MRDRFAQLALTGRKFVFVIGRGFSVFGRVFDVNADVGGFGVDETARPDVVDVNVGRRFQFDVAIEPAEAFRVGGEPDAVRDVVVLAINSASWAAAMSMLTL